MLKLTEAGDLTEHCRVYKFVRRRILFYFVVFQLSVR